MRYDEKYLKDDNNWIEFGLLDYFEGNQKIADPFDVADEAARILEAEEYSPLEGMVATVSVASFRLAVKKCAGKFGVNYEQLLEELMP